MELNIAQRLALNIDSHIVIDAGAGTGKTKTIVHRVIEHYLSKDQRATRILPVPERQTSHGGGMLVAGPKDRTNANEWGGLLPGEVVLLTFTNRAADEMRDRLREEISKLSMGSSHHGEEKRSDPRLERAGDAEFLLALLDDAPIGTIDSFFNQLVTPYRGILGDALSRDNISDVRRVLIRESALNTLWRLQNSSKGIADAVDAGVPVAIAKDALDARDRIQRHYSGRKKATGVISAMLNKSVFIDEGVRNLVNKHGTIDTESLRSAILESVEHSMIVAFCDEIHAKLDTFCQDVKSNLSDLGGPWETGSRMDCLNSLTTNGPPADIWQKILWLGHVNQCTASRSQLFEKRSKFFPSGTLPNDDWKRGISNLGSLKSHFENLANLYNELWITQSGEICLHFSHVASLLDHTLPPAVHSDWDPRVVEIPDELPEYAPSHGKNKLSFNLAHEARNLDDLRLVVAAYRGIITKLKARDEVHDFDDIQRLAGDLLLANCPEACNELYHPDIIAALDANSDEPWRDDHIHSAFATLEKFEANPNLAGAHAEHLGKIRTDLSHRFELLKTIRRRYRAFIIDEAQDNSPVQWRLLSRLWGEREKKEGDPPIPDTPWQPTICYVGDVKQSIYAFRQAEVTGFRRYAEILQHINQQEFSSIPALTNAPALRKEEKSRDPRYAHDRPIETAAKMLEGGGIGHLDWIPFDLSDKGLPAPKPAEIRQRKKGLISLKINYRTDGGLLRVMNEWWKDVFSPRHRNVKGEFYADSQELIPSPENRSQRGGLEWLCPLNKEIATNAPTDLTTYLDAFGPGEVDSYERQATLVALRIKTLLEGKSVRVRSSDGRWNIIEQTEPISASEIMILLPTRRKIRDVLIRVLEDHGIDAQADREGGLLERPAVHTLNGLLQFISRPRNRHNAAWVARSCLIGMSDAELQEFISGAKKNENLLERLLDFAINERQESLIERWIEKSRSGEIINLLEDTIDRSDLLVSFSSQSVLQDVEQFVEMIRQLSSETGGDPIVLADRIRELREQDSNSMEAVTIPPNDAVRIMTIHGSKGLQAKVIFLVDVFSGRQANIQHENTSRAIVSPELFAGNPYPWTDAHKPESGLWRHAKWVYQARKDAEARRLLYVGATRAKNRLIIVGSPKGTTWKNPGDSKNIEIVGLEVPWSYCKPQTQLGQMWLESLRIGSWRRGEKDSIWSDKDDFKDTVNAPTKVNSNKYLNPFSMQSRAFLGDSDLHGMIVLHHSDCFDVDDSESASVLAESPFVRISKIHHAAENSSTRKKSAFPPARIDSAPRIRIAPHRLSILGQCSRRHWFETRGGLASNPIISANDSSVAKDLAKGVDAATLGKIVHRIVEIGIPNPGSVDRDELLAPLPLSWRVENANRMSEEGLHAEVFGELLPAGADKVGVQKIVEKMISNLDSGHLGKLLNVGIDKIQVDGLRTEMPFHIALEAPFDGLTRTRWTPDGAEPLARFDSAFVEMDGIIDLVLCTSDENDSFIRAIDLKTEEARKLQSGEMDGLLESAGIDSIEPSCSSEIEMLRHHGMQLALYHRALLSMENARAERGLPTRQVLRPAIWVGVTGRLVEYPKDMFDEAQIELDKVLIRAAKMALSSDESISSHPRLTGSAASACSTCPFSRGDSPICGPGESEV